MASEPNILDKIVSVKQQEIAAAKTAIPEHELRAMLADSPPARGFLDALMQDRSIQLIAEIKKASPSKGIIREDFRPAEIGRIYQAHGAACVSVLTDEAFFLGGPDVLQTVRQAISVPILRKDFVLDPYQVLEARVWGADAVLLIAECLPGDDLKRLYSAVRELGMTALVEFFETRHLARVLDCGARLVGVNNRDLRSFRTDLNHTIQLRRQIPEDRLVVGESGIHNRTDVCRLEQAGVNAILVGEHLMRADDIGGAVDCLLDR